MSTGTSPRTVVVSLPTSSSCHSYFFVRSSCWISLLPLSWTTLTILLGLLLPEFVFVWTMKYDNMKVRTFFPKTKSPTEIRRSLVPTTWGSSSRRGRKLTPVACKYFCPSIISPCVFLISEEKFITQRLWKSWRTLTLLLALEKSARTRWHTRDWSGHFDRGHHWDEKKMKKTDRRLSMLSLLQDEQSLSIEHADVFNHKKVVIL